MGCSARARGRRRRAARRCTGGSRGGAAWREHTRARSRRITPASGDQPTRARGARPPAPPGLLRARRREQAHARLATPGREGVRGLRPGAVRLRGRRGALLPAAAGAWLRDREPARRHRARGRAPARVAPARVLCPARRHGRERLPVARRVVPDVAPSPPAAPAGRAPHRGRGRGAAVLGPGVPGQRARRARARGGRGLAPGGGRAGAGLARAPRPAAPAARACSAPGWACPWPSPWRPGASGGPW